MGSGRKFVSDFRGDVISCRVLLSPSIAVYGTYIDRNTFLQTHLGSLTCLFQIFEPYLCNYNDDFTRIKTLSYRKDQVPPALTHFYCRVSFVFYNFFTPVKEI